MRWMVGLAMGFLVLLLMNGLLIYVAVSGSEPVAPSYLSEAR
jgi:hypothetical protein